MNLLGLLFEITFFAIGLYCYLLARGFVGPQNEKAVAFRKKNGWWLRLLGLAVMAVMGLNLGLRIYAAAA